jgi:hypothetical protein
MSHSFLRRFCQILSGFHFFEFRKSIFVLQRKVVSLVSPSERWSSYTPYNRPLTGLYLISSIMLSCAHNIYLSQGWINIIIGLTVLCEPWTSSDTSVSLLCSQPHSSKSYSQSPDILDHTVFPSQFGSPNIPSPFRSGIRHNLDWPTIFHTCNMSGPV